MLRPGALLLAGALALSAGARDFEVTLRPARAGLRCEVTSIAGAAPFDRPLAVAEPSLVALKLDDAGTELKITSDCWSDPVALDGKTAATVELWPVASVIGEVALPRTAKPPRTLSGAFIDADSAACEHTTTCSLSERAWRCAVPAGRPLHLRLAVDDFAPVYVWDIEAREAVFDTGIHTLVTGASVAGRVQPVADATLTLVPLFAAHQPAADRNLTKLTGRANAKGWFQFSGVPPGRYRLTSRSPGRADAAVEVDVRSDRDVLLDAPLVHAPLAELEAILSPPVAPSGRPWNLLLKRASDRLQIMERAGEGSAGPNGIWTKNGLQPGAYLLSVSDGESEVAQELLELSGGPERIAIAITTIQVHGTLTAGGKPLKATVQFDLIALPPRRVRIDTDNDGRFNVSFPCPGEWRPSVWMASEVKLPPIEIRKPHDEELELKLPGGRLVARVLGANGKPTPAAVHLQRDGKLAAQGLTDDEGRLEMFGVEGEYDVMAESEDAFGGPVPISVAGDEVTELELRLSDIREVAGQIVSSDGSAASGAIVRSLDDITRTFQETIADGRGMYSFKVKPGADFVDLIVLAPPHPIAFRRIAVAQGRKSSVPRIVLSPGAAILRIPPTGSMPPWPTITAPNGRSFSLYLLLAPQFVGSRAMPEYVNGAFEFSVEPGAYVVCTPKNECRSALLAPNAETVVNWAGTP